MKRLTVARMLSVLGALLAASVLIALLGTLVGSSSARPWQGLSDEASFTIIFRYRLLRVLLAVVVGGSLAVCGVAFQALLRNPLADPYVLGISGGASLGAATAIWLGLGSLLGLSAVPAAAFAGALAATFLVYSLAGREGRQSPHTLILVGVIVNSFFAAAIRFVTTRSAFHARLAAAHWMMGEMPENISPGELAAFAALALAGTAAIWPLSRTFNLLGLGEDEARTLGESVERAKLAGFLIGSLLTAAAVAVAGPIGFVGLVVPHLLRLKLGPDHRLLVPASLLGGGIFLALSDAVARSAPGGPLPVGVVTAFLGCPFFLYLLKKGGDAQ